MLTQEATGAITLRAVFWPGAAGRKLSVSRPCASAITGVTCSEPAIVSILVLSGTKLIVSVASPTLRSGDIVVSIEGAVVFGLGRDCAAHETGTRVTLRLEEGAQLGATVAATCTPANSSQ